MSFLDLSTNEGSSTTMTITRALVELKTIDKRIQKTTEESVFISLTGELRKIGPRVLKAESNYNRITDLMSRRVRLKSAIVISNALTKVTINEMDLTVAEAIELKSSIKNYKNLLNKMKYQYGEVVKQMEIDNDRARRNLENTLSRTKDDDKDSINVNVEEYSRSHMKMNGVELYDPIKLQEKIEKLETFITGFENEVDFSLSEKNALTTITV